MNEKVTVSSKGKLRDTSFVAWNDRWVKDAPTQSIEGEYQHSKIESAKATVTKTDKGFDVDWGDEVQSFTGKNAQDKTLAALKSEDYAKQGQETAPITRDDSRSVAPIQNEKDAVVVDSIAPVVEAQHIEKGLVEEVTNEIIRESLAKVDDKPVNGKTMSLKEAKQWLLDQVSTAIAISPSNKLDYKADSLIEAIKLLDTPRDRAENKDQINAAKKELESYYITFDVPNDGVFKVLNNVESLQKFKKKVEANRGFDKQSPKKVFPFLLKIQQIILLQNF